MDMIQNNQMELFSLCLMVLIQMKNHAVSGDLEEGRKLTNILNNFNPFHQEAPFLKVLQQCQNI